MRTDIVAATDPGAVKAARRVLERGGLVAFPTDTVYGLGAAVLNREAVARLYSVKGRAAEKAIPVLAASAEALHTVVQPMPATAAKLAERFWPGPLTLVVARRPELPPDISPYDTVAVRVPGHAVALALLDAAGPLAVTSANRAGGPDSRSAIDVLATLGGAFDLLLDGGKSPGGSPSTVVDCTGEEPRILREGPITAEDIAAALA
jgi:L-threonylcarbamoyladenylate synthase